MSLGRVLRCEPPRLLVFSWDEDSGPPSEVTFELAPKGDQVLLTLTHRKLADRDAMVNVSDGWHAHLAILEDVLAGRTPPSFWRVWEGLEEAYDARLPAG